jgi:hypothetical protein
MAKNTATGCLVCSFRSIRVGQVGVERQSKILVLQYIHTFPNRITETVNNVGIETALVQRCTLQRLDGKLGCLDVGNGR